MENKFEFTEGVLSKVVIDETYEYNGKTVTNKGTTISIYTGDDTQNREPEFYRTFRSKYPVKVFDSKNKPMSIKPYEIPYGSKILVAWKPNDNSNHSDYLNGIKILEMSEIVNPFEGV